MTYISHTDKNGNRHIRRVQPAIRIYDWAIAITIGLCTGVILGQVL